LITDYTKVIDLICDCDNVISSVNVPIYPPDIFSVMFDTIPICVESFS